MNNVIKLKCKRCGCEFLSKDENTEICLACRVSEDMKLPKDTIVNQNLVNIWMAGKYDRVNGIDSTYLMVAEGAYLVEKRVRPVEQLCSKIAYFGEKDDDEIESYARNVRYRKDIRKSYDVLVFLRISQRSKFHVFGVSFSDRLMKKLAQKTNVFKKQYAISLAIKWYMKQQ